MTPAKEQLGELALATYLLVQDAADEDNDFDEYEDDEDDGGRRRPTTRVVGLKTCVPTN
jgi:hypothetical protein